MNSAKELGQAIKRRESKICVEGDLAKKVLKIHATGPVAWAVCIGALGVAITATIMVMVPDPAEPLELAAAGISLGCASAVLGSAAATAVGIGVAAGGIAGLTSLRKYEIVSNKPNKLILQKKSPY